MPSGKGRSEPINLRASEIGYFKAFRRKINLIWPEHCETLHLRWLGFPLSLLAVLLSTCLAQKCKKSGCFSLWPCTQEDLEAPVNLEEDLGEGLFQSAYPCTIPLAPAFSGHKKHRTFEAGRDPWCHPVQALKQGHLQLGAQDHVHWLQRCCRDAGRYTKMLGDTPSHQGLIYARKYSSVCLTHLVFFMHYLKRHLSLCSPD